MEDYLDLLFLTVLIGAIGFYIVKIKQIKLKLKLQEMETKEYYFYPKDKLRRTTIAAVLDIENKQLLFGKSECSKKDPYDKKKGRKIAIGRAKSPHRLLSLPLENLDNIKEIGQAFVETAKTL